ncbi:metal ABC transporter substrate-binding protein [Yoonia sp. 208BN28-4]|uniref:metal ABC transporter substrate-binding protein n=1 Tax=Yoonia sp. 208BN28-4 TaxID=3126505 RepID=UPI0030B64E2E
MLRRLLSAWLFVFVASGATAQDRPQVVAVNYPLQYFAERLLGDDADVVFPVPADVDPSFWRPTVADITTIQSADLILLNGAGFATWVDRVSLPRAKTVNTTAAIEDQFIFTESITHSHGEGEEHSHEGLASYLWLDPTLAAAQAQAVADAITARGLSPADDVAARMAELQADLEALDTQASSALADLQDVTIITTHPRYQYLARRYGLTVNSLEWEAGAAPTDDELDALTSLITETGARVLIWEATPPEAAFAQTAALGVENVVFVSLAHQSDDSKFIDAFSDGLAALTTLTSQ